MLCSIQSKKKIYIIAALVLLLLTRWMFFRLEIDKNADPLCFAVEAVCVFIMYTISLFAVPKFVHYIVWLLCCAALAFAGVSSEITAHNALPLISVYAPAWWFYIMQYAPKTEKKNTLYPVADMAGMVVCLLVLIGMFIHLIAASGVSFQSGAVRTAIVFLLIAILYYLIARTQASLKKRWHKKCGFSYQKAHETFAVLFSRFHSLICCVFVHECL